jgi:hypothetical protein
MAKALIHAHLRWFAFLLGLFLAVPVGAYDDIPHSANAIRDAYFLGTRQGVLLTTSSRRMRIGFLNSKREPVRRG